MRNLTIKVLAFFLTTIFIAPLTLNGQENSIYVWDFTDRNGQTSDMTVNLTDEFEEALFRTNCCQILQRRNYARLFSQRENENAIYGFNSLSLDLKSKLKKIKANVVVFGELHDDTFSGLFKVSISIENFSGEIVNKASEYMPKFDIYNPSKREEVVKKMIDKLGINPLKKQHVEKKQDPTLTFSAIKKIRDEIIDFKYQAGHVLEGNLPDHITPSKDKGTFGFQVVTYWQELQRDFILYVYKNKVYFTNEYLTKVDDAFELLLQAERKRNNDDDWINNNLDEATAQYADFVTAFYKFLDTITVITDEQLMVIKQ